MCQTRNRDLLRNGHAGDPQTQGHALADIIDALNEIPKREEVLDMIQKSLAIHANTCANSRATNGGKQEQKPPEDNRLKLTFGKLLGFEAQGKAGVAISAIFWAILGGVATVAIFHAGELAGLWGK